MLKLVCENGNWYYSLDGWRAEYIDTNRYELVEKKDWKLNQLKEKLNVVDANINYYSEHIDQCINALSEQKKSQDDLKQQIKDLKK